MSKDVILLLLFKNVALSGIFNFRYCKRCAIHKANQPREDKATETFGFSNRPTHEKHKLEV